MGLERSIEIEETDECSVVNIIETTGDYDVSLNPTGYGTPNFASASATLMTLIVLAYGQTTGYTFTFTLASGVITACTVTDPAGTITDIYADLTWTVFPFTEDQPFVLNSSWIGYAEDEAITSGAFNFESEVTDGTDDNNYTATSDDLLVCTTCCCVKNMEADLDPECCDGCGDDALNKVRKARVFLNGAIEAMARGEVDKSQLQLLLAQEICSGKCKTC